MLQWTHDLCKYGEIFFHRELLIGEGIIGIDPLPGIDVEIFYVDEKGIGKKEKRFRLRNMSEIFSPLEMWHVRLMGDSRYAPYGVSMLDKARRIFNQLRLAEDAMLVYRAVRAPERRVFKVDVGNVDDKDILPYLQEYKQKMKGDPIVDSKTGNMDLRAKYLSVEQDYFIPVRQGGTGSVIETLPGASNLNEIADIEYLQRKLTTALRIPRVYLGFDNAVGGGKNLSMEDLRFSRTITNKIQPSIIAALNELAKIHLSLIGLESEIDSFQLFLTNPSTQAEMVKLELFKQRIEVYKQATDVQGGIAAMSVTNAKRQILGLSDDDIVEDVRQQRFERAVMGELEKTKEIVASTRIFDGVDKAMEMMPASAQTVAAGVAPSMGADLGGFGGTMAGGGLESLGAGMPPIGGGEMSAPPTLPMTTPEAWLRKTDRGKMILDHLSDTRVFDRFALSVKPPSASETLTAKQGMLQEDTDSAIAGAMPKDAMDSVMEEMEKLLGHGQK